ncbi:hypothetical protein MalM25_11310 [Planctomycetes bacterium MalM25]|nr:hypothetical protein MalM25_11310 [Planctomycetes bacterium MalM25]
MRSVCSCCVSAVLGLSRALLAADAEANVISIDAVHPESGSISSRDVGFTFVQAVEFGFESVDFSELGETAFRYTFKAPAGKQFAANMPAGSSLFFDARFDLFIAGEYTDSSPKLTFEEYSGSSVSLQRSEVEMPAATDLGTKVFAIYDVLEDASFTFTAFTVESVIPADYDELVEFGTGDVQFSRLGAFYPLSLLPSGAHDPSLFLLVDTAVVPEPTVLCSLALTVALVVSAQRNCV